MKEPEYFKCPECGHRTELKESNLCLMTICERCRLAGNRNLWDKWADSERICLEWRKAYETLETELERTRKALDVAVDALKDIDKTRSAANHKIGTQDKTLNSGIVFCWTTPDEIHNALEQMTALEQKEKK